MTTTKNPATIKFPRTVHSPEEALQLAGMITGLRRIGKPSGRNGGRPAVKEKCLCGQMTLERAAKRKHVCEVKPAPP